MTQNDFGFQYLFALFKYFIFSKFLEFLFDFTIFKNCKENFLLCDLKLQHI
ncbi:hypothetical protein IC582_014611 [Cucumis melo]